MKYKIQPTQHQLDYLDNHAFKKAWGLLWDPGTGKTKASIENFLLLYHKNLINGVLVICPSGLKTTWIHDEIPKHVDSDLLKSFLLYEYESNKAKSKKAQYKQYKLINHQGLSIVAINYEATITSFGSQFIDAFLSSRQCMIILDESTHIKTFSPQKSKNKTTHKIISYSDKSLYRRILTGTPITQSPFDCYSQLEFLVPGFWKSHGYNSYTGFQRSFANYRRAFTYQVSKRTGEKEKRFFNQLVSYKNISKLRDILASTTTRIQKEDVLDLPAKVYKKLYIELSPNQQRHYKELKKDFITYINNEEVTATMAISQMSKFRQIVGGHLDGHLIDKTSPKLATLKDFLSDCDQKVIIWCDFLREVEMLSSELNNSVTYCSKTSNDDRKKAVDLFQNGSAKYFISTSAAAKGLTLTSSTVSIYFSNFLSLENRLQSEDRNHRIGQSHSVLYIDIIAKNTLDEHIVNNLRKKFDISSQITKDKMREWI